MNSEIYTTAIIVAAGKGKRMGAKINKQYIYIKDKPMLTYTLEIFDKHPMISEIVLVVGEKEIDFCRENIVNYYGFKKITAIVAGGNQRRDSVYNGLQAVKDHCEVLLIHDGARPFVSQRVISDSIQTARKEGASVVAVPVKDTIKIINDDMEIMETPERKYLWAAQTPQAFQYSLIKKAYDILGKEEGEWTDDGMLLEKMGIPVKVVKGDYCNIKVTTPEDLYWAEALLNRKEE